MDDDIHDNFDTSPLIKRQKKKKINSRTKGNRFENKIAKKLNERFNTEEFCRSPGSGAFATTHKLPEYLKVYGDLITPKNFKYIIECKKGYNEVKIDDLFNTKSIFSNMIAQASRDSKKSSRKFILIIGQDRRDPVAITNQIGIPAHNKLEGTVGDITISILKLEDLLSLDDSYFLSDDTE
jgi:hypothetical protein